ncbi:Xyloglucan endotransglucosylase/hydrolase [Psidium guajava]|nr:Xyloglucan endotransglucosylase/hydrolase [Psidium guajava]
MLDWKLMFTLVADFQQKKPSVLNPTFLYGLGSILQDPSLEREFVAKAITVPGAVCSGAIEREVTNPSLMSVIDLSGSKLQHSFLGALGGSLTFVKPLSSSPPYKKQVCILPLILLYFRD